MMIKKITIVLVLIIPSLSFGQYDYGFLNETFFGRQPGARAEALGKSYSSIDGDLATIFYNPAGTATLKGLELNASFGSPYYLLEDAKYNFLSAGYNINQYLTVGISRNYFSFGQEVNINDSLGNPMVTGHTPTNSVYSFNFSSQPVKNLYVGLNVNYLTWNPLDETASTVYFDLGIIKKFQFGQKVTTQHAVNIGTSVTNLNFAEIKLDFNGNEYKSDLPVINRYGVNYQFDLNKKLISDTLSTLKLLLLADYQFLWNSDYHSGFHIGSEFMFLEILSLRIGYYNENQKNYDKPSVNEDELKSFTYGFGLQIPLHKLTKVPLIFNFDFVSMPQASYSKTQTDLDNFTTYTFRLNWLLKG